MHVWCGEGVHVCECMGVDVWVCVDVFVCVGRVCVCVGVCGHVKHNMCLIYHPDI